MLKDYIYIQHCGGVLKVTLHQRRQHHSKQNNNCRTADTVTAGLQPQISQTNIKYN